MQAGWGSGFGPRSSDRAEGRSGGRVGWRRVSSGGGLDGGVEAERLELAQEPAGAVLGRVAAGEPVGSEFAEGDAVAADVVVGDQDVVAGGADRFLLAAATADLPVVGGEVGALSPGGGAGGLGQCGA